MLEKMLRVVHLNGDDPFIGRPACIWRFLVEVEQETCGRSRPRDNHRHPRSSRKQDIFRRMLCLCYTPRDIPSNMVLRLMPGKEAAESLPAAARGGNTSTRSGTD
jgi:hypothetical protein